VASGIIWSTNGTGSFLDASSPNGVYYPSALDQGSPTITLTMTTTGNGTCNPASNQIVVTISPQPVVDAGANMSICAGQANAVLNGIVTNAAGGVWTSTGTGTFNDANSLNTTYIPTPQDFQNGGILLTLTSTGNGVCAAVSDVISVNILPSPAAVVNAGLDQVLCSDVTEISLTGYISNAGGGLWSTSATGTFNPNNTTLEAKYIPTAADKTAGMVVLTLATTDNGMCSSVADDMRVTFTPAPTVTVSGPASVCGDVAGIIPVNGTFTVATGGIWTTGGTGVFAPDASGNAPTYYPSPVDKAIGKVGLTYTTTGNGTCQPVSQTLTVTITKPPVINAGADQIVCASNASVNLNAFVSIATGGTWVTSGSGTFGNDAALATVYNPSTADTANKVVNLLVTSTGNGTCTPVTDAVKITFTPVPITIAGADRTVCANNSSISIIGKVQNATGGIWTTNGSGNFANPTGLTTAYTPSAADITNGNVTLRLESTGNGKCSPVADQLTITLQPVPQVKAGTVMICQIEYGAPLAGDITSAVGGVWSSNGTGVFAPDNTDLNAVYYPSLADAAKGNVTLTLTSTGNGECSSVSENTILSIDPMPIANAGADRFTCPGSTITLAAQPGTGLFYNWLEEGAGIIGSGSNIQVTPTGRTNYILAVTNMKGCTSTDTLTADLFIMPTLNLLPNYCLSNSLIVDGIPTPQPSVPGSYSWTLDGKFVSGNNTPIISPIDPGQYILTFAYENCMTSEVTRVNPKPKLIGGFLKDCIGKASDVTVKANGGGFLYNWSNGLSGTDINTINVSVTADTTYYVALVTNPATGCSNKDSVRVIGIPIPNLNLTDMSSCQGLSYVLNGRPTNIANLDSLYPEYVWMKDNNLLATDVDNITVNTSGLYKEVLTIGQCITADSAQVDFHVNPISNLPDYTKFCRADDNKAIIDAGSGANHTYVWTAPPGIVLDSSNTQSITVRKEGTYYVTVTNQFNCSIDDSIFVDELCGPRTDGPNAIIPGDPQNGTFRIYGAYFKNYKLMIFNRWGEVIFESTNQKEGWDGTYLGEPMPIGVYPYLVTYDSEDPSIDKHYKKEGSVMIIK
jgi:gliding motility-associated-like protein